jgi:hypothetical protein
MPNRKWITIVCTLFLAALLFGWSSEAVFAADYVRTPKVENSDVSLPDEEIYRVKGEGYFKSPLVSDGEEAVLRPGSVLVSLSDQPFKSESAAVASMWPWLMLLVTVVSVLGYAWSLRQSLLARWR